MRECYICGKEAEISGQDLGRRKIVRCHQCRYYEITQTAAGQLLAGKLMDCRIPVLAKRVDDIHAEGGEALVFWEKNSAQIVDKRTIQD